VSFFGKIKSFFVVVGKTLASAVVAFARSDAAKAILQSAEGKIINAIVQSLNGQTFASLSNDEKRRLAFSQAKNQIVNAGLDVRDHMIDLAISTVIASLKNLGPRP
jgi:predicted negative regulator of RcsB-dependent stress response